MPRPAKTPQCETVEVFAALERVNVEIARSESAEEMLTRVLDAMLDIFSSDRAWLLYPCRDDTNEFMVPVERTRPEWPGARALNEQIPANDYVRQVFSTCLSSERPVAYDPEHNQIDLSAEVTVQFNIKSQLLLAIRPQGDDPWLLGIHHCGSARLYDNASTLFQAIGGRVADGLSTFIATRDLRQSEERFRTLVEQAPEAIVIFDCEDGSFVDANPKAEKLFGVSRIELLNSRRIAQFSPASQPEGALSLDYMQQRVAEALAGEFPVFEWTYQSDEGQQTPCQVCLARLPHPTRSLVRGSITDISRRKQAEKERAGLEAKLVQAQKLEAIGQLTGGVAHDFNNLLTVIMGNLELANDMQNDPDFVKESVSEAYRAAERASTLIQRLLAFSRMQPLQPQNLDLGQLLKGMDNLLQRSLGEDIEIEFLVDDELWLCTADEAQLENTILNLCLNARDAMNGGGQLQLAVNNVELDEEYASQNEEVVAGQYLALEVSDNGCGIPPGIIDEVFAPFFTTKGVGKGSGLGLSMVYGFVRQSGGHVQVESEERIGTTMRIYLPRATTSGTVQTGTLDMGAMPQGEGEWVLVVEDDDAVRTITTTMLKQLNYNTLEAENGPAALTLLSQNNDIKILLTDVVLPGGMTGVELAHQALRKNPSLCALYISGYTAKAINKKGHIQNEGVQLLKKPFTKAALATALRSTLRPVTGEEGVHGVHGVHGVRPWNTLT